MIGSNNGPHGGHHLHPSRTTAMTATTTTTTIKQQAEALTAAMGYDLPHTFEADLTAFTEALSTWEPPTAVIEGRITGASLMTLREDPTMAALDELRNDVQALIADLECEEERGPIMATLETLRALLATILGIEE